MSIVLIGYNMFRALTQLVNFVGFFVVLTPSFVYASELSHDGYFRLYHSHRNEFLEIEYEKNKQFVPGALDKINYFMRSRDSGKVAEINPKLIVLLDHLGDHFKVNTIEVICGYRSAEFNRQLKNEGRNVADQSTHILGMAADIHLDEVPESSLASYAWKLRQGGVGYYPDLMMVHVDLGEKRKWQEGHFSNRTDIGIFNPASSFQLKTDRVFYFSKDAIQLAVNFPKKTFQLNLEKFYLGQWRRLSQLVVVSNQTIKIQDLGILPGKYRFRYEKASRWQNSNEFYLKR